MALKSVSTLRRGCSLWLLLHLLVANVSTSPENEKILQRDRRALPILRIPSAVLTSVEPNLEDVEPTEASNGRINLCNLNTPTPPVNGQIEVRSFTATSSELEISCLDGFTWATNPRTTQFYCNNDDGVWFIQQGQFPECLPVCDPPCLSGGSCFAPDSCSCPSGFSGDRCENQDSSSSSAYCDILPSPSNGAVQCSLSTFQTTCEATCLQDFHFEGGATKLTYICNNQMKIWVPSSSFPDCISDFDSDVCTSPTAPYNGRVSCQRQARETICASTCDDGFVMENGETTISYTCDHVTQQWSPSTAFPSCHAICDPPCQNNGICQAPGECLCVHGFQGDYCEIGPQDYCENNLCQHGSTCVSNVQSQNYQCLCPNGFNGFYCEHAICETPRAPPAGAYSCMLLGNVKTCQLQCLPDHQPSVQVAPSYQCDFDVDVWVPELPDVQCLSIAEPTDAMIPTGYPTVDPVGSDQPDQVAISNSVFKVVASPMMRWSDANKYCRDVYGDEGVTAHLAILASEEARATVRDYLNADPALAHPDSRGYWVGCNDQTTEGQFLWLNGSSISPEAWSPDQPNNNTCKESDGDQDCCQLWEKPRRNPLFEIDDECCDKEKPFICQIENPVPVMPNPDPQPGGYCYTWGQSHYRTFDGRVYFFRGSCSYLLAGDCFDNSFKIHVHNQQQCAEPEHCQRSLSVFIGDLEFSLEMREDGFGISKGSTELHVPVSDSGLLFERIGQYLVVHSGLGFTLRWDGREGVSVTTDEGLAGKTCGLCGKYSEDYSDDLTDINGDIVTSVTEFAISYKMDDLADDECPDGNQQPSCHYSNQENIYQAQLAESLCIGLKSMDFAACHDIVSPDAYYQACKEDVCGCQGNGGDCQCNSYEAYAKECNRHGVTIQWRNENRCPFACQGGMVYDQCGSSCPKTCKKTAYHCINDQCIDGCHCPQGTVLHEGVCIRQEECPCIHGGREYSTGSEIPHDDGCNVCTCGGGEWTCTQIQCGATCVARGDPHYRTFDGRRYSFMGECSYVLLKSLDSDYSIVAENVHCGRKATCTKSVMITVGDTFLRLKRHHHLIVNGNDLEMSDLPHKMPGVFIEQLSDQFQQVVLDNGVQLRWDGKTKVYIKVKADFYNKTCGLCGTFDRNQENDFWTLEGDIERQPSAFGDKWSVDSNCLPAVTPPTDPCDVFTQKKQQAERMCSALKQAPFTDCHNLVNVDYTYAECMYDMCSSEGTESVEEILCDFLASYALECANKGHILAWRDAVIVDNTPICPVQCDKGKVYQECGSSCQTSCAAMAARLHCEEECNPGCSCPPGMVEDYHGNCIPVEDCVCKYNGRVYLSGDVTQQDCKACSCVRGAWHCEERDCEPTAVQCGDNMEFAECKDICPETCANMHLRTTGRCTSNAFECVSGCQCKQGYVLDGDKCVSPVECPCHHGGKSYSTGQTISVDCNTCLCNGQHWVCEDNQCPSVCSVWGESHHETFDGKIYEFQGQCSYVLSQSSPDNPHLEYSIAVENIPCGTSDVTCTKSVVVGVQSDGKQHKVHLVRGSPISVPYGSPFQIWEAGLFVFLHIGKGVTLQWDKGTTVSLKLDAIHRGKVEGLCGNFNGDQMDDFTTPAGGPPAVTPLQFGDSWKVHDYCPDSAYINDTCMFAPHRKAWATRMCSILKSEVFQRCHSEVPFEPYFERCVFDSCGCDMGGDCECLCTAIAAYAQKCNRNGVPVRWRSQELCPVQCEGCGHYEACTAACPRTCDNYFNYDSVVDQCDQTCVEGCECPSDEVYDASTNRCISPSECYCVMVNGVKYSDGQIIPSYSDGCQTCYCSNHTIHCLGQPCTPYSTPFSPTTVPTLMTTVASTPLTTTYGWTTSPATTSITTSGASTTAAITQRPTTEVRTTREIVRSTTGMPSSTRGTPTEPTEVHTTEQETTVSPSTGVTEGATTQLPTTVSVPCDSWTPWLNSHTPTLSAQKELEILENVRYTFSLCASPSAIKCRTVNTHFRPNQHDQNITCDLSTGLTCSNNDQISGLCFDYEVSFFCPCGLATTATPPQTTASTEVTTPSTVQTTEGTTTPPTVMTTPALLPASCNKTGWTSWMNVDSPGFTRDDGDHEIMTTLRRHFSFCRHPEAIQCRDRTTGLSYEELNQNHVQCVPMYGLQCQNSLQPENHICADYEVRFFCRCEVEITTLPSTSTSTPEVTMPAVSFTPTPGTVEPSTEQVYFTTSEEAANTTVVTATTAATPSVPPTLCSPGFTDWFNIDTPDDGDDVETLEGLRKFYSFCRFPEAIECRTLYSGLPYTETGESVVCNLQEGLICLDVLQDDNMCEDYMVRFDCGYCGATSLPPTSGTQIVTETTSYSVTTTQETVTTPEGTTTPEETTKQTSAPPATTPPASQSTVVTSSTAAPVSTERPPTTQPISTKPVITTTQPTTLGTLAPECSFHGWGQWMDVSYPSMQGDGEYETFPNLRKYYVFCEQPVDIQCRVVNSDRLYDQAGQRGVTCDVNHGLLCLHRDQRPPQIPRCYNYEVRVYCICETPTPPVITTETVITTTTVTATTTVTKMKTTAPGTTKAFTTPEVTTGQKEGNYTTVLPTGKAQTTVSVPEVTTGQKEVNYTTALPTGKVQTTVSVPEVTTGQKEVNYTTALPTGKVQTTVSVPEVTTGQKEVNYTTALPTGKVQTTVSVPEVTTGQKEVNYTTALPTGKAQTTVSVPEVTTGQKEVNYTTVLPTGKVQTTVSVPEVTTGQKEVNYTTVLPTGRTHQRSVCLK
ncbi:mucin-5AC-like [Ptychodera flava]|uniref:mucin-5AC-like n=1 Tax=Ptychodera flava TaxID=63121 RepID=UPI00396A2D90